MVDFKLWLQGLTPHLHCHVHPLNQVYLHVPPLAQPYGHSALGVTSLFAVYLHLNLHLEHRLLSISSDRTKGSFSLTQCSHRGYNRIVVQVT